MSCSSRYSRREWSGSIEIAQGVGDRVVHVDEVERGLLGDLREARRERDLVRRVAEERVGRDLDLVEPDLRPPEGP